MKKLIVALAVLTVVFVLVALQMQDNNRVADLQSRPLLSDDQKTALADVDRVTVARDDQVVELVRQDGTWGVANHDMYPVQRQRMAALLHAVRGARVIEEYTADPAHHARLGLAPQAEGASTLSVGLQAGEQQLGVLYGNAVGSGQLVRFEDQNQVWMIDRPLSMSVNSLDWLALDIIAMPMEGVASARWEHADGEVLELGKAEQGDYNLRLVDLDPSFQAGNERWINGMVLALINLRAQNVALRSSLDLAEPILRMQVTTWDDARLEASLHDVGGKYWLVIDDFQQPEDGTLGVNDDPRWAFQLGIGQIENLIKRRSDIVRAPEEA
ncbi:MAG TPA: DUF4340 domain-containing protein [Pseudomonas xinjiangensis]|uniref:DUF4340 domain-containing protein n=2 Tax=root TaxID=1 RepID=A0A7V1FRZ2_9GAMM|nr:DUF4340 domain-containing protein [Halopseudomonas xinjiangensis]HEC46632.1 DUF4340 domain-containing protein [Halopseudomonas xinjiangensis]